MKKFKNKFGVGNNSKLLLFIILLLIILFYFRSRSKFGDVSNVTLGEIVDSEPIFSSSAGVITSGLTESDSTQIEKEVKNYMNNIGYNNSYNYISYYDDGGFRVYQSSSDLPLRNPIKIFTLKLFKFNDNSSTNPAEQEEAPARDAEYAMMKQKEAEAETQLLADTVSARAAAGATRAVAAMQAREAQKQLAEMGFLLRV